MDLDNQHRASGEFQNWHLLTPRQAIQRLDSSDDSGLSAAEASRRLAQFGPNEITTIDRRTGFAILSAQLKSSLVVLLLAAIVISLLVGEFSDAVAIFAIVVLNTLLGFWQDYRAEKSLAELKKLSVPEVVVRREGDTRAVAAGDLVPGDLVMLRAGFFVPADGRLLETTDLAVDESALTGESLAVEKSTDPLNAEHLSLGDRKNLVFSGTLVARGHAAMLVTATGMQTALGEIAGSLQSVEAEPTPLQIRLNQLSRSLALSAIVIVASVFLAGLLAGQDAKLMLLTALSLAVAIVPEGLPAVATVALAIGAKRMFRRNALIRQLPAVETLGSVSVICSDKTGTLTQNKMTATILDVAGCRGHVRDLENRPSSSALRLLLTGACLCNDARLQLQGNEGDGSRPIDSAMEPVAVGEPTEKALVEVAARFGIDQHQLEAFFPRIAEAAFDADRKRMTTVHSNRHQAGAAPADIPQCLLKLEQIAFVKGAVEAVLDVSSHVWVDDGALPLTGDWIAKIEKSRNEMAQEGTRVLAIGFRSSDSHQNVLQLENDLIFVGLVGLSDPPRPEAKSAVSQCRRAGIRPIMITGDHPLTALSIASQLGIAQDQSVVSGQQLATMSVESLRNCVRNHSVFARVAPSDKLHIVEALQHAGEVVAMTGDGVNDAPALKQANVGVAMGLTGTDVSKEAANMVLIDDNFATIVAAVEQGRIVYDNIRKFVKYTMSSNIGEVLVMTLGVILGMPLPLLPLQILWINLVTDGLPGLALAVEPVEKNTMERPPFPLDEAILNRRTMWDLLWIGSLIGIASLGTGAVLASPEANVAHWRTVVFTVLTFSQMGNVLSCRFVGTWAWHGGVQRNVWLWAAIAITCVLQLAVIYWPRLQSIFHTQPLTITQLLICAVVGGIVFIFIEIHKFLFPVRASTPTAN